MASLCRQKPSKPAEVGQLIRQIEIDKDVGKTMTNYKNKMNLFSSFILAQAESHPSSFQYIPLKNFPPLKLSLVTVKELFTVETVG